MNKKTRVLVVDDDIAISRLLCANLVMRGYHVSTAMDGEAAIATLEREVFDLVILDIMMPRLNGLEVCTRLRGWSKIPIIMVSAKEDEGDKVKCFELGADDYITKPFGIDEFLARVKTALRHAGMFETNLAKPVLTYGDIEINIAGRRVTQCGREVKLTPIEYLLLQELTTNANKVLTHKFLLQKVWGTEYAEEREYLRVFINRLRRKLTDNSKFIATVPHIGYQFVTENS